MRERKDAKYHFGPVNISYVWYLHYPKVKTSVGFCDFDHMIPRFMLHFLHSAVSTFHMDEDPTEAFLLVFNQATTTS